MTIPPGYSWLSTIGPLPKMIGAALELYGIHEGPGAVNNPVILGWAAEVGLAREYTADSIPWCGLFMAVVAKHAGYPAPAHPLWALNWGAFGQADHQPCLGDVLVFVREGGGHVGLYVGEDAAAFHVLGGNESDQVTVTRIAKIRLHAVRVPIFRIGRPATSRPFVLSPGGSLSVNEQ